jgi:hypothetical protein
LQDGEKKRQRDATDDADVFAAFVAEDGDSSLN